MRQTGQEGGTPMSSWARKKRYRQPWQQGCLDAQVLLTPGGRPMKIRPQMMHRCGRPLAHAGRRTQRLGRNAGGRTQQIGHIGAL